MTGSFRSQAGEVSRALDVEELSGLSGHVNMAQTQLLINNQDQYFTGGNQTLPMESTKQLQ